MRIEGKTIVEAWKTIEGGYKEFSIIRTDDGGFFGVMLDRQMHHLNPPTYQAVGLGGSLADIMAEFRKADDDLAKEIAFNLTWSA